MVSSIVTVVVNTSTGLVDDCTDTSAVVKFSVNRFSSAIFSARVLSSAVVSNSMVSVVNWLALLTADSSSASCPTFMMILILLITLGSPFFEFGKLSL